MNFRNLLLAALSALALACGAAKQEGDAGPAGPGDSGVEEDGGATDAGEQPDAGPADAGGGDAGVFDAGVPCDRSEPCTLGWTEPEHYPVVVDHHTSFVHPGDGGAYFYVVGGARSVAGDVKEVYPTIRRAKLKADGLEPWAEVGVLPTGLGFAAQVVSGDRVYLLAGLSMDSAGPYASAKVMIGAISPVDGSISWTFGPPVTEVILHGTAVVLDQRLYLIGGSAQAPKDKVLVSAIAADGSLGPWAVAPALPQPRSHHTAVVHGGRIFLIGGFSTNQVPLTPILRSQHDATGALTGWAVAGDMPNPPWTAGASVVGESLLVVGGGEGGSGQELFVDRVRQARFLFDNTLTGFRDLTPLPVARSHVHQAPIFEGKLYSVGGRLWPSGSSMDRVFVGAFQQ